MDHKDQKFNSWLEQTRQHLEKYVAGCVVDVNVAAEITQEVFVYVCSHKPRKELENSVCKANEELKRNLFIKAKWVCIDWIKSVKRRRIYEANETCIENENLSHRIEIVSPRSLEDIVLAKDLHQHIENGINLLPPADAKIVELFRDGLNKSQIAVEVRLDQQL